jgi:hypothetical protein
MLWLYERGLEDVRIEPPDDDRKPAPDILAPIV